MESEQAPSIGATLDDMITHNELLERYPWLSAQIINGWIRRGLIRTFRGAKGVMVYSRAELDQALNEDLRREVPEAEAPATSAARTPEHDAAEAAIISERLWRRSIKGKKGCRLTKRKILNAD